MRILLDECLDEGLRRAFPGQQCETCRYAGLKGLSNGELLGAAENAGFEVLITVDQNIRYQQNLRGRAISLVVLQPRTTNLDDLVALSPNVLEALEVLRPVEVIVIAVR